MIPVWGGTRKPAHGEPAEVILPLKQVKTFVFKKGASLRVPHALNYLVPAR